jgi:capsid portal protein
MDSLVPNGHKIVNNKHITGTKQITPKDVKVSTLFSIEQHKRNFTDYKNKNKSSQQVGLGGGGRDTIPHQY